MKKITKFLSVLLSFILIVGFSGTSFAVDYGVMESKGRIDQRFNIPNNNELVQEFTIPEDVELTQDEDGNFSGEFTIVDPQFIDTATVKFRLLNDANYQNLYEIFYNISSSTLVNGYVTDIKITDTSFLSPTTYFDGNVNRGFAATTFYSGSAGMVAIPYEVKKVKIKTKNSKLYFLSYGWRSGFNVSTTINVN